MPSAPNTASGVLNDFGGSRAGQASPDITFEFTDGHAYEVDLEQYH